MLSCYALISTSPVSAPVATGRMLNVPYCPGHRYVTFLARNSEDVCNLIYNQMGNLLFSQAGRVDLSEERPVFLVYFEHCFPVLDVKKVVYSYT